VKRGNERDFAILGDTLLSRLGGTNPDNEFAEPPEVRRCATA